MEPVGGLNGWKMGEKVYGSDGNVRGTIYHGGREDLFTLVSGGVSDEVREAVCSVGNARTSRVDTRIDTLTPFADLAALLAEAADRAGTRIITIDSRVRGVNLGRTVYLGAPTSRIRVRLYEKWLEAPGEYAEGTNRVEVQLRPDSGSKAMVSGWSRPETFACSPMTRRLADLLGLDEGSTVALQTGRRKAPDLDRSIAAMGRQYGRATREFLHRYDGDVSKLLGYLAVDEDTLGREVLIEGP